MKPTDEELRALQELSGQKKALEEARGMDEALAKARDENAKLCQLRGINGGAQALTPELQQHRQHMDMHADNLDRQARLFVAHCRELVALGATRVEMFGCAATFEPKK